MKFGVAIVMALAPFCFAVTASAQQMFFYPAEGQSEDQLNRDRGECYAWAVQQTGYDPANPPTAGAPAPEAQQGGLVRGAARGAAVGAVGGAIGGDAGKGAAIGAATGGMIGGLRRRDQRARQEQQARNQQSQAQAGRDNYNRALKTCMEGRGYSVN